MRLLYQFVAYLLVITILFGSASARLQAKPGADPPAAAPVAVASAPVAGGGAAPTSTGGTAPTSTDVGGIAPSDPSNNAGTAPGTAGSGDSIIGPAVGGAVGGIVAVGAIAGLAVFLVKRRNNKASAGPRPDLEAAEMTPPKEAPPKPEEKKPKASKKKEEKASDSSESEKPAFAPKKSKASVSQPTSGARESRILAHIALHSQDLSVLAKAASGDAPAAAAAAAEEPKADEPDEDEPEPQEEEAEEQPHDSDDGGDADVQPDNGDEVDEDW